MQLNIKNPETVALARELGALMDKSVTQALTEVLRERVNEERKKEADPLAKRFAKARAMAAEFRAHTDMTHDSHAEDLYDEDGLPK